MANRSSPTASTASGATAAGGARRGGGAARLWRSPLFPAALQAAALAGLVAMIAAGWGRTGLPGGGVAVPLLYTNLAALGFWTVWLMALLLLLPATGRLWCTVCPVGWCNEAASRVGARRAYPRRWRTLGGAAALLLGLNVAAESFGMNRSPDLTAKLLAATLLAAVAAGLLFRGRVFCSFWCPVGAMIGTVDRLAPIEVATKDPAVCRRCDSKACFHGRSRWYRLSVSAWHTIFPGNRPGCPAHIFPPEEAPGPACLMCTGCIKNCPFDNVRWGRRPVGAGLWSAAPRDRSEALVVLVLAGLVFYRLARFWPALRGVAEWPAARIVEALPPLPVTAVKAIVLLVCYLGWPLAFFLLLGLLAKGAAETSVTEWPAPGEEPTGLLADAADLDRETRRRERGWAARRHSLWGFLASFGSAFVPLLAGGYAAFALVKLNEKLGYLPLALRDPAGVKTSVAINQVRVLAAPESLVPLLLVRWGALALAAAGLAGGLWAAGRIGASVYGEGSPAARRGAMVFRAGVLALGVLLLLSLKAWLFRAGMGG